MAPEPPKLEYATPPAGRPLTVLRVFSGMAALMVALVSIVAFGVGGGMLVSLLISWKSIGSVSAAIQAAVIGFFGLVMIFVSVQWFVRAFSSEVPEEQKRR